MKLAVRPALLRLAIIDEKLRTGSWPNASSLARELEVTSRTIHRDIEYLRDQRSAPIAFDPKKNGYHYTEHSYRLPYLSVSEGECVALFLAERLLQQYRGTPFAGDIARLFHKVVNLLTESITINMEHLNDGNGPAQTVRLRFKAHAARYVREKDWHPTQKVRVNGDGSLTLTFRVNHLLEVKRWVLSFGADCEVLAPKELTEQIYSEVRIMLGE